MCNAVTQSNPIYILSIEQIKYFALQIANGKIEIDYLQEPRKLVKLKYGETNFDWCISYNLHSWDLPNLAVEHEEIL